MCFSTSSGFRSLPEPSTLAHTLTALLRSNRSSASSRTRMAAAAPSLIGAHIGSVSGHEIIREPRTSSIEIALRYCDSGLKVECWWFLEATAASCRSVVPKLFMWNLASAA
jgi:hypothetical protein